VHVRMRMCSHTQHLALSMEPKAEGQLHSWQCKADLYADDGKNALLYSPALVLSALLFNEWAFWFKGWDPIISLLLGRSYHPILSSRFCHPIILSYHPILSFRFCSVGQCTPTCTFPKKEKRNSHCGVTMQIHAINVQINMQMGL